MNDEVPAAGPGDRFLADTEEIFESMWPEILSQTVIELLAEFGSVSRKQLIETLEARRDAENASRLDKAKIRGALRALRGD